MISIKGSVLRTRLALVGELAPGRRPEARARPPDQPGARRPGLAARLGLVPVRARQAPRRGDRPGAGRRAGRVLREARRGLRREEPRRGGRAPRASSCPATPRPSSRRPRSSTRTTTTRGGGTTRRSGEKEAVLTTLDAETFSAPDCLTVVGWYRRALEMCGAQVAARGRGGVPGEGRRRLPLPAELVSSSAHLDQLGAAVVEALDVEPPAVRGAPAGAGPGRRGARRGRAPGGRPARRAAPPRPSARPAPTRRRPRAASAPGRRPRPPRRARRGRPRRSRAAAPAPGTRAAPRPPRGRRAARRAAPACRRAAPRSPTGSPARAGPCATISPPIEATQGTASGDASRSTTRTRAESRRGGETRTTRPLPRPSPSAAVQAVAGSRSRASGPTRRPLAVSRRICATGTGPRLVVRRAEAVEDHEAADLPPPPNEPPSAAHQVAEAAGPRHAAREARREHPRGRGVEVHLVAEAQRVARDALVPGLARDHRPPGLEREAAGELQARVRAARAGRSAARGRGASSDGTSQTRSAWAGSRQRSARTRWP